MTVRNPYRTLLSILAAILLLVTLCVAGVHEASAAHTDKHSLDHCTICFAAQTFHSSNLASPAIIPSPIVMEEVPYVLPALKEVVFSTILSFGAPPTGPPLK